MRVMTTIQFGNLISRELKKNGWTVETLEERSGVAKCSIDGYLNNKQNPTFRSFIAILRAFGMKAEALPDDKDTLVTG